jgi:DNA polymerase-1
VKGSLAESEEWLRVNTPDPDPSVYPKGWPKGLFNPRSTKQVAHVLYDQFGLPVLERTEKGAPGTSAAVLTDLVFYSGEISEPWRQQLISHRSLQKQVSSYLESWPKLLDSDDKFHPRFKPLHVVTGRLSSEHPNIQNVPRDPRYRGVFGGVKDHSWVKVDLSQIELRIAAWLAEEEAMLDALRGGYDLHAQTAELILGDTALRQTGKALNFSLLYGAYPAKLREIAARDYGVVLTPEEAEAYHRKFFETYPGLKWWHQQMEANILATGRSESPLGRIRVLPDAFLSDRGLQNKAVREGINHPVQSFASDLMLMSLVRVTKAFPGLVVATVHDELDLIVPNDVLDTVVPAVVATMEDTSWLEQWGINFDVPVIAEADIGGYWNGD